MLFLLFGAPKARVVVAGAPLYLIDVLLAMLLLVALNNRGLPNRGSNQIPLLVGVFFSMVCLSEIHSAIVFGTPAASLYMVFRFGLAASLAFTMPRLLDSGEILSAAMKGLVAGALFSATVTILYSLPATRPLVTNTVFSTDFLAPETESLSRALAYYSAEAGVRGRSLLGAATFTSGVLGAVWPLVLFARKVFSNEARWLTAATIGALIVPIAILMTYGRTAWLSVIVVSSVLLAGRSSGGRRTVLLLVAVTAVIVHLAGWRSEVLMVDRVVNKTRVTFQDPTFGKAERERTLSYTEPFEHLTENPLWLVVGSGRSSARLSRRGRLGGELLVNEGARATHSTFSITYYSFGMVAAVSILLSVALIGRMLYSRIQGAARTYGGVDRETWQLLLASWAGLGIWMLAGHGVGGEPRGTMVFFLITGLTLAANRVQLAWQRDGESRSR
jgi:hypothetical protein